MNSMTNYTKSEIDFEELELDRFNPRLVLNSDKDYKDEESIISSLIKEADIPELIDSIISNGYLNIEPLIVTKDKASDTSKFRVLEGNRRLCALKLLNNPKLAKKLAIQVPDDLPEKVIKTSRKLSVIIVDNEAHARSFIGFKHVNGPHKWNSFAKAKFLLEWYLSEFHNGITIEDIAQSMGDKNSTVRSLISGLLVLNQAIELGLFSISDREKGGAFGFSHLYTALGRIEFRDFLGLDKDWNLLPKQNPVSEKYINNLKEVLLYIYGSKSDKKKSVIVSQNPDLGNLGRVLANENAKAVLAATDSLSAAIEELSEPDKLFEDALIIAKIKTQEALQKLGKLDNSKKQFMKSVADELLNSAQIIHSFIFKN